MAHTEQLEIVIESKSQHGSLHPILPQSTGRYEVQKQVSRGNRFVEPGMFTSSRDASPTYLLPQWTSTVHPEGKLYFYRETGLRVVTEADLYDTETAEQICDWIARVEKLAEEQDIALPASVELYLQLDEEDCNYYFADSATQTVFWLTRLDTHELGLLPVSSDSHLKLVLEVQYWAHVENFCMHFGGLPKSCIDELILVFSHGLADNLTSHLSTFPYDMNKNEKFLNLLTSSRDRICDGRTVCYVARLWGLIVYNRYETHYGQDQSRLSRDSAIIIDDNEEIESFKPALSLLTLNAFETYNTRFNALFVDRFVYGNDWDAFMTFCIKGWQQSMIASAGVLFLHIFCFFLPVSPFLAYTSGSLATLSIMTGALLIHRHEDLDNAGASPAFDYLEAICSPRFKFQGAAFSFALPRTFLSWSLITVFIQWALVLCQHIYISQAAFFVGLVLSIFLCIHFATSRRPLPRPKLIMWFWRKMSGSKKAEASVV